MMSSWMFDDRVRPPSFIGTTVLGTNILLVVSLSKGTIRLGQTLPEVFGIPANTTVTGFGTGIGGIGTYTMSANTGIGAGTGLMVVLG